VTVSTISRAAAFFETAASGLTGLAGLAEFTCDFLMTFTFNLPVTSAPLLVLYDLEYEFQMNDLLLAFITKQFRCQTLDE
jgi:hypothetical protein